MQCPGNTVVHHRVVYPQVSAEVRSVSAGPPPKKIVVSKPQAVQDKLRNLLHHSVLFAGLEDEALQDVINAMFQLQVEAGATLITYDDAYLPCVIAGF